MKERPQSARPLRTARPQSALGSRERNDSNQIQRLSDKTFSQKHFARPESVCSMRSSTKRGLTKISSQPTIGSQGWRSMGIGRRPSSAFGQKNLNNALPETVRTLRDINLEYETYDLDISFVTRGEGVRRKKHLRKTSNKFLITPDVIDFKEVLLNTKKTKYITLQNLSAAFTRFKLLPLENKNISIKLIPDSLRIAAGMISKIELTLDATSLGMVHEEIIIMAGEAYQYTIPIMGHVVEDMGPDEDMLCLDEDILHIVPRLRNSLFNWKTETLEVEHDSDYFFDKDLPVEEIKKRDEAIMADKLKRPVPSGCRRIYDQVRPFDELQEDVQQFVIDEDIYKVLEEEQALMEAENGNDQVPDDE